MKQIIIQNSPVIEEGEFRNQKKNIQNSEFRTQNLSCKIGEFLTVKITKAVPFKVYGEII